LTDTVNVNSISLEQCWHVVRESKRTPTRRTVTSTVRIAMFGGSLRSASFNTRLLNVAARIAEATSEVDVLSIRDLPFYDQDHDPGTGGAAYPRAVADFRQRISVADGVLIVTPEYSWSVPGVVKNAIDWCSRPPMDCPLTGKPVLLAGASLGPAGTGRAQLHLRQILQSMRALVLLNELQVPFAQTKFDEAGFSDRALEQHLERLVAELVSDARAATEADLRLRYRI
jgi:chromate reductase, NAD(P)H dehydrogenase (quinone)